MSHGNAEGVHVDAEIGAVEVAAHERYAIAVAGGIDDRIVRAGVQLLRHGNVGFLDGTLGSAHHLCHTAQGIGVLHTVALIFLGNLAALEQIENVLGTFLLLGMVLYAVQARIEVLDVALVGLIRECGHDFGGLGSFHGVIGRKTGETGCTRRAVEQ